MTISKQSRRNDEKSNEGGGGNGTDRRKGDGGYTNSGSNPGQSGNDGDDSESNLKLGKRIVDIQGLSNYLKVCVNTIYSWVSQGKIPSIKMGRLLRFNLDKIDAWIEERERNVNSEAA